MNALDSLFEKSDYEKTVIGMTLTKDGHNLITGIIGIVQPYLAACIDPQ